MSCAQIIKTRGHFSAENCETRSLSVVYKSQNRHIVSHFGALGKYLDSHIHKCNLSPYLPHDNPKTIPHVPFYFPEFGESFMHAEMISLRFRIWIGTLRYISLSLDFSYFTAIESEKTRNTP